MKGAFSETSKYDDLTDYEIKISEKSDDLCSITVKQTFEDEGQLPAYDLPVIKKGVEWFVVIENIIVQTSSYKNSTAAKALSSGGTPSEILASNDDITVIRRSVNLDALPFQSQQSDVIETLASSKAFYDKALYNYVYTTVTDYFIAENPNSNTTVKGYQYTCPTDTPDCAKKAWIGYHLMKVSGSTTLNVSSLSNWGNCRAAARPLLNVYHLEPTN
ncbi:hypothetical protein [Paenibacillus taiwanensis]|uniref:hypothetical protein n=1 Tax=Paenibacillus taiwanensis TaxID=401638 RepID=UPI00040D4352|nr:hypothetical protein [Paenibacillus taiwanensis]